MPTPAVKAQLAHVNDRMLIFITDSGELRYWPIDRRGGRQSYPLGVLSGVAKPTAMAAFGNSIAVADAKPSSVAVYDLATKKQTTLPDRSGSPIDVTYDAKGDIVALNSYADVVVYATPGFKATVLRCGLVDSSTRYVAVDRKGDIFVNEQIDSNAGVIEIPKGATGYEPSKCSQLRIQETGYAAGLLVDSTTDALVVFNDPDLCAGGDEGEMAVYGKPYGRGTKTLKNLHGNCAYALRFGPEDQQVFFLDGSPTVVRKKAKPDDGGIHVSQRAYPAGSGFGEYRDPALSIGVATIPNEH